MVHLLLSREGKRLNELQVKAQAIAAKSSDRRCFIHSMAIGLQNFVSAVSDIMGTHFVKFCCVGHLSMSLSEPSDVYDNSIVSGTELW